MDGHILTMGMCERACCMNGCFIDKYVLWMGIF